MRALGSNRTCPRICRTVRVTLGNNFRALGLSFPDCKMRPFLMPPRGRAVRAAMRVSGGAQRGSWHVGALPKCWLLLLQAFSVGGWGGSLHQARGEGGHTGPASRAWLSHLPFMPHALPPEPLPGRDRQPTAGCAGNVSLILLRGLC